MFQADLKTSIFFIGEFLANPYLNHMLPADTKYQNVSDFTVALYEIAKRIEPLQNCIRPNGAGRTAV